MILVATETGRSFIGKDRNGCGCQRSQGKKDKRRKSRASRSGRVEVVWMRGPLEAD